MALAKCPKCGYPSFSKEETNVGNGAYQVAIIRCASCNTAIGATLPDWALEVLDKLPMQLNKLKKSLEP